VNATVCVAQCPAGTFIANSVQCLGCPSGTISKAGAAECKACPAGTVAVNGTECKAEKKDDDEGGNAIYYILAFGTIAVIVFVVVYQRRKRAREIENDAHSSLISRN